MRIQALGDYVIVIPPKKIEKTESGIYLTDEAKRELNTPIKGLEVISVGEKVKNIN